MHRAAMEKEHSISSRRAHRIYTDIVQWWRRLAATLAIQKFFRVTAAKHKVTQRRKLLRTVAYMRQRKSRALLLSYFSRLVDACRLTRLFIRISARRISRRFKRMFVTRRMAKMVIRRRRNLVLLIYFARMYLSLIHI